MFNITLRSYESKDKLKLQEMIPALYDENPEGEAIDIIIISKTIETLSMYPQKGEIIIMEEQEDIIGYSLIILYWSNEYGGDLVNIDELYVKPKYRGNGYATYFMEYVFSHYSDNTIILEVTPSNIKAYNYYKKLGFKDIENRHMIKKN
ncbi:GNAT family N-acetyltransferase [Vallitalea okinawensis]|uniref:GNAT family N-acetyltransferase n=1 Tax=Vallitalea okinawensis TaxID=2078660 RepID=UPI000CFB878B|nr:GNAT family N-acetyltransferase [Vallitalea okinawensis]